MAELVGGADHEVLEAVARIEDRGGRRRHRLLLAGRLDVDGEQQLGAGRADLGQGAVEDRPVALLDGVDEVFGGRREQQPAVFAALQAQRAEPGIELLRIEELLELLAKRGPERTAHLAFRRLVFQQLFHSCGKACAREDTQSNKERRGPGCRRTRLQQALLAYFDREQRDLPWRENRDPYRIWISEVMLQQTQVVTVLPYYRAFLERFPSVAALAAAGEDEVLAAWSGLGYYRRASPAARRRRAGRGGRRLPADCRRLAGPAGHRTLYRGGDRLAGRRRGGAGARRQRRAGALRGGSPWPRIPRRRRPAPFCSRPRRRCSTRAVRATPTRP